MAKDSLDTVCQKHTLEYTLVDDDSIPPSASNNKQGWFVVRQKSRENNIIKTGLLINIPNEYDLILVDLTGTKTTFISGRNIPLNFQLVEPIVTADNQKVGYIRLCHYPQFEMTQIKNF